MRPSKWVFAALALSTPASAWATTISCMVEEASTGRGGSSWTQIVFATRDLTKQPLDGWDWTVDYSNGHQDHGYVLQYVLEGYGSEKSVRFGPSFRYWKPRCTAVLHPYVSYHPGPGSEGPKPPTGRGGPLPQ